MPSFNLCISTQSLFNVLAWQILSNEMTILRKMTLNVALIFDEPA